MKKVMFVVPAMGRGGAERVVSVLSNYYAEQGMAVCICLICHSEVSYELDRRIEVRDLSNDRIPAKLDIPRMVLALRREIKRFCPDTVVSFMAQMTMISGLALTGMKVRFVPSERIDPSQVHRAWLYRKLIEYYYASADAVVMQTERARDYFNDRIRRNSVIIPNPVQVAAAAVSSSKKKIVTAGRLTGQKNHKLLISAFSAFAQDHPEYSLHIYGEGTLREQLQEQIERMGLSDAVRLMGNVPDLHRQIADAAMFVLSSDFEGLSNALLEALMMGLPTITTDCAGSEVITSGENGFVVPVGDADALAKAMQKVADDPELAAELSRRGRSTAQEYAVDSVIGKWNQVIFPENAERQEI